MIGCCDRSDEVTVPTSRRGALVARRKLHDGRRRFAPLAVIAALLVLLAVPPTSATADTYEGTVTHGATALQHVIVEVSYSNEGKEQDLGEAETDSSGNFHLVDTGAPKGLSTTFVKFHYPGYLTQWYNGASSFSTATPIPYEGIAVHKAIDASMIEAGAVSGKVTDAATGLPVSGVSVQALTPDGQAFVGSPAFTDATGAYTLQNMPPGGVKVQFQTSGSVYYTDQYYGGKFTLAEAETVSVNAAQATANINIALVHAGRIAGRISDASSGVGLTTVFVHVYDSAGQQVALVANGLTGGNYQASVPGGGSYTVAFIDGSSMPTYATQYYNHKATLACADPVAVAGDQTVANINAAMTTSSASLGTCGSGGGPGGGGGGGGSPTASKILTILKALLPPSGKAATIDALVRAGGYAYAFKALEGGVAEIDWYQLPHGAHIAKVKPKPKLVARGRASFSTAATETLKVKLTAAGRSLLKHARRIRLTAKGTFTPTGQARVSTTLPFTLKG